MSTKTKMIAMAMFAMLNVTVCAQNLKIDKVEVRGRVIEPKTDELGRTFYDLGVVLAGRNDGDVCKMIVFNTSNTALELEMTKYGYVSFLKNNSKRYNESLQPNGKSVVSFVCTSSAIQKEIGSVKITANTIDHNEQKTSLNVGFNYYGLSNSEQLAFMELDGKWGAKDIDQKTVIPFEYEGIKNLGIWGIPAKKNGKWGWINRDNNVLIPFEYDDVIGGFKNDLARVEKNEDYYVINEKNAVVYKLPKNGGVNTNLIAVFEKQGRYGYINSDNEVLIPAEYTNARAFNDGLAVVQKNGKWGALNKNNQLIIPFEYEDLFIKMNSSRLYAKKNGKWGLIDENNKVVVLFQYDDWMDVK